jgi:subtilisin family serine protease
MKILYILISLFLFSSSAFSQYDRLKVTSQLAEELENKPASEKVRVIITVKGGVNPETFSYGLDRMSLSDAERYSVLLNTLKSTAASTQASLLSYLSYLKHSGAADEFNPFWIANCISASVDIASLKYLTYRSDIELIEVDNPIYFDEAVNSGPAVQTSAASETGLKVIKADRLWKLGFTGAGRIVMNVDSGVDGNHPALNYKWRGLEVPWYHAWFDAGGTSFPTWCTDHGTHTMGIMCGYGTGTGDTVGVAPNAKWIAARRSCSGNYTNFGIAAFQWAMDPDSNSSTLDQPDVINCSWNSSDPSGNECNGTFRTTLLTLEAAGIAVVWSAGNSGPGASTVTAPKNINANLVNAFTVGAVDGNNSSYPVASFSSRGPSLCGGSGSLLIKPEVSAPGVNVRSSVLSSGYATMSGTSMAAPHVSGSVALLKSFAPKLKGSQVLTAIYNSASDLGSAGEDNTYGMGLVNVYNAMLLLGPQVVHTPIGDTPVVAGPYKVRAVITPSLITNSRVDTARLKVFWGRGSSITDSITMQRESGNTWVANIPGNGSPAAYKYYIRALDSLSVRGQSPGDAPLTVHSFNAGVVGLSGTQAEIPDAYSLYQNYPNPFNPSTKIKFDIPQANTVLLAVYDASGKQIAVLINSRLNAGSYEVEWDAAALPSGIYFYRFTSGPYSGTKKMLLIK